MLSDFQNSGLFFVGLYGKNKSRGLNCGSTYSIFQDILKSEHILDKRDFAKTSFLHTVNHQF